MVFWSFGSIAIEVMKRFGSPAALAMCQPSEVIRLGGSAPPTFVAIPFLNFADWLRMSHTPQKPTYTASPRTWIADIEFAGSVVDEVADASPGCWAVPRL